MLNSGRFPVGLEFESINQVGPGIGTDSIEKGLGLPAMLERARMLKGSIEIESQQGSGTLVTCTIPIHN